MYVCVCGGVWVCVCVCVSQGSINTCILMDGLLVMTIIHS